MTAPGAVVAALGQSLAVTLMRDTCTVVRPSAVDGPLDPVTGLPTEGTATAVFSGRCRLRMAGTVSGSAARESAGDRAAVSTPVLSVPVVAARLVPGDVATITGVPLDDPAGHLRLGLRLRVTGLVLGTDMTAQRVTVETVTG